MKAYCKNCNKVLEVNSSRSGHAICPICGSAMSAVSTQLELGTIVSGFLIDSKIGQGGMGVVYKAKQINLDRFVALKVLSDELASDREFVERFFREARAAASLSHPNIVQVYDAGVGNGGIYYFAMELIEGETLEARILRDGVIAPKDALDIAHKIALALEYAWDKQKLFHGDIKPENIMLNSSGGVKLADLGLAKTHHDDKGHSKDGIMATPLYAAPEIIAGELHRSGAKSDMYSFGATLYHMLAGTPPFNDADINVILKKHLDERPKFLNDIYPELNPAIAKLVDNLLLKNPEDRPETWKDIVKAIEKIHNVERKVFHITHHSIEGKEKGVGDTSQPIPKISEQPQKNLLIRNLAILTFSLFVLLCALAVIVVIQRGKGGVKTSASPAKIAAEWEAMKDNVFYIAPEDAIERLDQFLIKYDKAISSEMLAAIEKTRAQLIQKKQEKDALEARKKDFQNELFLIKALISSDIAKEPVEKLVSIKLRIEALLDLSGKMPSAFAISEADRALLNDNYMRMVSIIIAYEKEQDRLRQEAEEKAERERAEKEKARIEEEKIKRKQLIISNSAIDEYYLSIANLAEAVSQRKDTGVILKDLSNLINNPQMPPQYRKRLEFLSSLSVSDITPILIKNANSFIGKRLSMEDIDPQFKIAEVTDKGVKLVKAMNDAVKMTKNISWKQIPFSIRKNMLIQLLNSDRLTEEDDRKKVFSFILLNGTEDMSAEFEKLLPTEKEAKNLYRSLFLDFFIVPQERELIFKWRSLIKAQESGDMRTAAGILNEIYNNSPFNSFFKNRYMPELKLLIRELKNFDPQVEATWIMLGFKEQIDKKSFAEALSTAMTAKSRVFASKTLNPVLKESIESGIAVALSNISQTARLKDAKDIRVPFLEGASKLPGYPLFAYEILKNDAAFRDNPAFLASVLMTGYFSAGDWEAALRTQKEKKVLDIPLIVKNRSKFYPWTNSFLISHGMLNLRYSGEMQKYMSPLDEMLRMPHATNSYIETAQFYLALRYAIVIRAYSKITDVIERYDFKGEGGNKSLQLKIALIHLLTLLNKTDASPELFEKKIAEYAGLFADFPPAVSDFKYLQLVNYLNKGNMSLSEEQQKALSEKLENPDLCLKLLSSVVAKNMISGRYPNPFGLVISKIRYGQSNSAFESNSVNHAFIFLANSHSLEKMLEKTSELLATYDLGMISLYPKLKILESVLSQNVKKTDLQLGRVFLEASSITSNMEKEIFAAILSGGFDKLTAKFASRGLIEDAYWSGIYGMILSGGDKNKVAEIEKEVLLNASFMTWEERLLIAKIKSLTVGK